MSPHCGVFSNEKPLKCHFLEWWDSRKFCSPQTGNRSFSVRDLHSVPGFVAYSVCVSGRWPNLRFLFGEMGLWSVPQKVTIPVKWDHIYAIVLETPTTKYMYNVFRCNIFVWIKSDWTLWPIIVSSLLCKSFGHISSVD